jgi:hypothetical protein
MAYRTRKCASRRRRGTRRTRRGGGFHYCWGGAGNC